jgi:hypothetical protein
VVAQHAIDSAFAALGVEPAALRTTFLDLVHQYV